MLVTGSAGLLPLVRGDAPVVSLGGGSWAAASAYVAPVGRVPLPRRERGTLAAGAPCRRGALEKLFGWIRATLPSARGYSVTRPRRSAGRFAAVDEAGARSPRSPTLPARRATSLRAEVRGRGSAGSARKIDARILRSRSRTDTRVRAIGRPRRRRGAERLRTQPARRRGVDATPKGTDAITSGHVRGTLGGQP